MAYYPVLIQLDGMKVLVVGGGKVSERKVDGLLEAGAEVCLVASKITPFLSSLAESGKIRLMGAAFEESHLDGLSLVIAATNDPVLNSKVSSMARAKGILVNAVDQPKDCTFIVPSVARRGDLLIAVSTSGKSPALAKRLREVLQAQFGEEYSVFLSFMGALRERVLGMKYSQERNSSIFQAIVDSEVLNALGVRDMTRACRVLEAIVPDSVEYKDLLSQSFQQGSLP